MWRFQKEDGSFIPHAYLDGYNFGDTLLEGVLFKITITPDKKFKAEITPSSKAFFEQFNQEYWLKRAEEYANTEDIFCETEQGGDDIIVFDDETKIESPHFPHRKV